MQTMPRAPSDNTFQVAFKIPEEWVATADRIAGMMSRPGVTLTRTDALRAALFKGLELFDTDLAPPKGVASKKSPKK